MTDTCFMIQPFDGGRFDKLFEDVFQPSVEKAGLMPYRVDRDPSVSIPIEQIEAGIKSSRLCFVDLSLDNPNVWFELGYAIATQKDLCLVCSSTRTKYPFDVQHRTVISYNSDSPRDFIELSGKITRRVQALITKQENIEIATLPGVTTPREGLAAHEISCLIAIASEVSGLEAEVTNFQIKREMALMGYNNLGSQVSLRSLIRQKFLSSRIITDQDNDSYETYSVTSKG